MGAAALVLVVSAAAVMVMAVAAAAPTVKKLPKHVARGPLPQAVEAVGPASAALVASAVVLAPAAAAMLAAVATPAGVPFVCVATPAAVPAVPTSAVALAAAALIMHGLDAHSQPNTSPSFESGMLPEAHGYLLS